MAHQTLLINDAVHTASEAADMLEAEGLYSEAPSILADVEFYGEARVGYGKKEAMEKLAKRIRKQGFAARVDKVRSSDPERPPAPSRQASEIYYDVVVRREDDLDHLLDDVFAAVDEMNLAQDQAPRSKEDRDDVRGMLKLMLAAMGSCPLPVEVSAVEAGQLSEKLIARGHKASVRSSDGSYESEATESGFCAFSALANLANGGLQALADVIAPGYVV
jgi:hypothetical protein